MDANQMGGFIARQRKSLGLTQVQLAERVHVSGKTVSKWENGTSDPSTSNLMALAKLYGVPAEDLLKGMLKGQDEEPCPQEESRL